MTPRIKNSALSFPGSPLLWYEITPASRPANAVVRLLDGIRKFLGSMASMEATTLAFFCFPKATTVTSSISLVCGDSVMKKSFFSPMKDQKIPKLPSFYPVPLPNLDEQDFQ